MPKRTFVVCLAALLTASCASSKGAADKSKPVEETSQAQLADQKDEVAESESGRAEPKKVWLTGENSAAEIRLRDVDAFVAMRFVGKARKYPFIAAWGGQTAVVSGDWSAKSTVDALTSMGEAVGLGSQMVDFDGEDDDVVVMAPPERLQGELEIFKPFTVGEPINVDFYHVQLQDVLDMLARQAGLDVQTKELDGYVTTVLNGITADQILNALVHLSGATVMQSEDGQAIHDSKLPGLTHFEPTCAQTKNPYSGYDWEEPTLEAGLDEVYLAGVNLDRRQRVLLATDPTHACILGKGKRFVVRPDGGKVRVWKVETIEAEGVKLVDITSEQRDGGEVEPAEPVTLELSGK